MTTTLPKTATEKEDAELLALQMLVEHGSARKAAAVLYCDRKTVHNRARNWLKRFLEADNSPRGEKIEQ